VSEKLRRISEIKTIQQRQGEMRALLDPDLFLAHLKKPEIAKINTSTESSIEIPTPPGVFKYLSRLSYKLAKILTEYEKVLREALVSNFIHIRLDTDTDVEQLVDDLNYIESKVLGIIGDLKSYADLALIFSFEDPDLVELVEVVDEVIKFLDNLHELTFATKDFLIYLHGFFAKTRIDEPYPEESIEDLYTLAYEFRKNGMRDLAVVLDNIASDIEKQVIKPQTADIVLGGIKLKPLYLTLDEAERKIMDIRIKVGPYSKFEVPIHQAWSAIVLPKYALSSMIRSAIELANIVDKLRNILSKFGYRSLHRHQISYLPSELTYNTEEVIWHIPDELTLSQFFNDVVHVIHEMTEMLLFYSDYLGKQVKSLDLYVFRIKNCPVPVYSSSDSGSLVNFAIAWMNTVCYLIQNNNITEADKDSLFGYISDDSTALFKVGMGLGYDAQVFKNNDTWTIEYFSNDTKINRILAKLWSAIPGVKVYIDDMSGVTAETKDEKILPFIGALLGFATSMDVKIYRYSDYLINRIIQHSEAISPQLALIVKTAFGI